MIGSVKFLADSHYSGTLEERYIPWIFPGTMPHVTCLRRACYGPLHLPWNFPSIPTHFVHFSYRCDMLEAPKRSSFTCPSETRTA